MLNDLVATVAARRPGGDVVARSDARADPAVASPSECVWLLLGAAPGCSAVCRVGRDEGGDVILLMTVAAVVCVLQLGVLGSWGRTVRLSTLLLAVALGFYACGTSWPSCSSWPGRGRSRP